jgi:hypothetical protein
MPAHIRPTLETFADSVVPTLVQTYQDVQSYVDAFIDPRVDLSEFRLWSDGPGLHSASVRAWGPRSADRALVDIGHCSACGLPRAGCMLTEARRGCPACAGLGHLTRDDRGTDDPLAPYCPYCGGSGWAPLPRADWVATTSAPASSGPRLPDATNPGARLMPFPPESATYLTGGTNVYGLDGEIIGYQPPSGPLASWPPVVTIAQTLIPGEVREIGITHLPAPTPRRTAWAHLRTSL